VVGPRHHSHQLAMVEIDTIADSERVRAIASAVLAR
jgi:hypothetical protein